MQIHVVQAGDTIESIASQYGVNAERLAYDNQLGEISRLVTGQSLLILTPNVTHTVAEGDTKESIASQYGISVKQLYRNNPYLVFQDTLTTGDVLVISYEGEKIREFVVGGYAYPFIDRNLLREILPFLTKLLVFSYGFTTDGELVEIDDEELIALAKEYGVKPILTLTPLDQYGAFNSYLVSVIASNPEVQETLIQNLIDVMQIKGYGGVDVDFEYIEGKDKEGYIGFIQNLTTRMNELGYEVSIAVAPKESDDFPGLLYEGIDYAALGEAANSVLLMTYEWGYTYSEPQAVAPINKVEDIIDYAVTRIPVEKIKMGIPNYGYDWRLPYERGVTKAQSIGNLQAVQIAADNGAVIQYDERAQSPYFNYTADTIEHEVWFEDVRSLNRKFELASNNELLGFGYWSLMKPFRANWLLLNSMYDIIDENV
ncbi:MAG: LysM peptidoglycan-binding domain-containing protein [Lachnospiraceae bacterium]|nr:LysM peptidoglycan-binding domain-containing protein [Lachnospiraceae bacterium]